MIKVEKGYTLIEILVGLTIIGVLFTTGYVGFRDFSRRQALSSAVKSVQGDLRLTQGYALAGQKPDDIFCNSPANLIGYNFNVVSSTEYRIEAVCTGGVVVLKSFNFTSDISILNSSPNPILFKILGTGTNITSDQGGIITLYQQGSDSQSSILIGSGGEIK